MRILLIILLPIGDTLFTTPAIHALRKRYPSAHITALLYPTNKGVLANNPDVNDFLMWPTRDTWHSFLSFPQLFLKIRRAHYDLAVEFSGYNWWISRWGRIPRRSNLILPRLWWLLPWAGTEWRRHHAVEHYSDVVRHLGIPVEDMQLRMEPSARDNARAEAWLDNYRVEPGELLIGVHPGGEGLWGRKQWGMEGFAHVADGLAYRLGARIMLMGGKEDAPLAAEIVSRCSSGIINATGQTTLGETAALAARCSLFIGNDSSPLHIAAATGTPVVGIYGVTDPRSYHPWVPGGRDGVDYAMVRSNVACSGSFSFAGGITFARWAKCLTCRALDYVTPEQVMKAAVNLMETRREREGVEMGGTGSAVPVGDSGSRPPTLS